jgi:hypothetical protein
LQQQPLDEITELLFLIAVLHGRRTVLASIFPGKLLIANIGRSHAALIGLIRFALAVSLGKFVAVIGSTRSDQAVDIRTARVRPSV